MPYPGASGSSAFFAQATKPPASVMTVDRRAMHGVIPLKKELDTLEYQESADVRKRVLSPAGGAGYG
jgi:hypothetical protein